MEPETIVTSETQAEYFANAPDDPPDMQKVREYFSGLQLELTKRVAAIELFLGFIEGTEALGVRVAKLEAFTGVK